MSAFTYVLTFGLFFGAVLYILERSNEPEKPRNSTAAGNLPTGSPGIMVMMVFAVKGMINTQKHSDETKNKSL